MRTKALALYTVQVPVPLVLCWRGWPLVAYQNSQTTLPVGTRTCWGDHSWGSGHDLAAEPKNRSRTRVIRQNHDLAARPQSRPDQDLGTQPGISRRPSHPWQPRFRLRTSSKPGDQSKGTRPGVGVKAPGTQPSHTLAPEPRFSALTRFPPQNQDLAA